MDGKGFGFSPSSTIDLSSVDIVERDSGPLRLSWHLNGNEGGWRAGSTTDLYTSTEWEKLIFTTIKTGKKFKGGGEGKREFGILIAKESGRGAWP